MIPWTNIIEAATEHKGFKRDPRLYIIHKHFREYPSKRESLGNNDINIIYEVGWRILGLSIPDEHLKDPELRAYVQGISIYVIDVIDDLISILKRSFLYNAISKLRIGGNLISRSVMGRDFDSEIYGDINIRIFYRNYYYTRLVLAIDPYSNDSYIPLYQDGISIFRKGYKKYVPNVYVERRVNGLYVTKLFDGGYHLYVEVKDNGRVQIDLRESET